MLDRISVPRRPFDFEDYVDIVRRNIGWIVGPAFVGLVLATVVAYVIPDTYVSKARIRVVPQQIPDSLVPPMNSQQLIDRVSSMAESLRSHDTLASVVSTNQLYKKELKSEPLQDVLEQMQTKDFKIALKDFPIVELSFAYSNPYIAQKVCSDLVSRLMNQSTQDNLGTQVATNGFFNDQYEQAKHDVEDLDRKLQAFRERNAGRLPEQMQLNISQMNALETRVTTLNEQANRTNSERMMLDSDIRIAKDRLAAIKDIPPVDEARDERLKELDDQIKILETKIANMKDRYTDQMPDLQSARQELAVQQRQRQELLKSNKSDMPENASVARQRMGAQESIDLLQTRLKTNQLEAQQINQELARTNGELKTYQSRATSVPAGETELTELTRDRDLAKTKYEQMEAARQKSQMSLAMERRKQGETLELVNQASLSTSPTAPKRAIIIPMGLIAGLIAGAVLIAIREMRNTSLKSLKDARLYTQLSVLGSVPLLENDLVVQRRKQMMWVGWATATLAGLAVIAASVFHYYLNKA